MKMWLFIAAVALVSALSSVTDGWAAARTHAFYFSVMGGGYLFESDEPLENSPVYTLGIGYSFSDRWMGEIVTGYINTRDADDNERIDGYPLRLDILYNFRPERRLVPHLAIGFGGLLFNDPGGDTDLESVFGYGLGLRYFVARSIALRADVRHLFVRENLRFEKGQNEDHFMATAGLTFQVGGGVLPPPQVDSDGDGVIDAFDRCPGTPLGVPVDVYGCPADSDGDGIPDHRDLCPDTPFGVKVDKHGCPLDDGRTTSPSTFLPPQFAPTARPAISLHNEEAQQNAKPVSPLAELTLYLSFTAGRSEIRTESAEELKRAVDFVRARPERLIVVEGHTDSIGGAEDNLELSRKRAESVRRYLLEEAGIAEERIEVQGYGDTRPVGDNATQEGRRQNRRIVIKEKQFEL